MIWNNKYSPEWNNRFALFPVTINGGKTIWMEKYQERYVELDKSKCANKCHTVGWWETRLIEKN